MMFVFKFDNYSLNAILKGMIYMRFLPILSLSERFKHKGNVIM